MIESYLWLILCLWAAQIVLILKWISLTEQKEVSLYSSGFKSKWLAAIISDSTSLQSSRITVKTWQIVTAAWDLLFLYSISIIMCALLAARCWSSASLRQGCFMCVTWLMRDRKVIRIFAPKGKRKAGGPVSEQWEIKPTKSSRKSDAEQRCTSAERPERSVQLAN